MSRSRPGARLPTAVPATAADWSEIADLRHRVFVLEQGVPAHIERDDADGAAVHALSRDARGVVVATGRLLERDGSAVIGRMAADPAARGAGHGAAVLDELHWQAVLRGLGTVQLHAQLTARGFYDRTGYIPLGPVYLEAGIEHVTMRRALPRLTADPAGGQWALFEPGDPGEPGEPGEPGAGRVLARVSVRRGPDGALDLTTSGDDVGGWLTRLTRLAEADLRSAGEL